MHNTILYYKNIYFNFCNNSKKQEHIFLLYLSEPTETL